MNDIKKYLENADVETLVVFDIDNTLYTPKDLLLRPCGVDFFKQLIYQYAGKISSEQLRYLSSIMISQRSVDLIDPNFPVIIKELQSNDIKTIALTAMQTGPYGQIESMEDWRYEELKKLDIDFRNAFPKFPHIIFEEMNTAYGLPVFKHGILASSRHTKGDVLVAFLKQIHWHPKKVIFIDDHLEFIESVSEEMKLRGIHFSGFHFVTEQFNTEKVNEEVARLQFEYLLEHQTWLSDDQALQMLKDKKL